VCYLCVHQHLPVDRAAQLLADVLGASVPPAPWSRGSPRVAVHDGWAPYWRYDVTHALRGAHLLRELEGVADEPGQGWAAGMAELLVDASWSPTGPRGGR
jgi:hypothetical protein